MRWAEMTTGAPSNLYQAGDGYLYDSQGNQYTYDPVNGLLKVIGSVSTPSIEPALQPYISAANFANGIEPWFYGFATLPIFGEASFGAIAGNFGSRGTGLVVNRMLARFLKNLSPAATPVTAASANAVAASKGYTQQPFAAGSPVGLIVTDAGPNSLGVFAGQQMVRVGTTAQSASAGPWFMPLSSITDANGNFLPPSTIQSIFSLPSAPEFYSLLEGVPVGSQVYVGISSAIFGGAGGGLQLFNATSRMVFGAVYPLGRTWRCTTACGPI